MTTAPEAQEPKSQFSLLMLVKGHKSLDAFDQEQGAALASSDFHALQTSAGLATLDHALLKEVLLCAQCAAMYG